MSSDMFLGYYGTYKRFDTVSKKDAPQLLGADNLVGDRFEIEFITKNGVSTAWMKNRFGGLVGYFDPETSRQLQIFQARGWVVTALLSFIASSNQGANRSYWGEAALVCYDPSDHSEAFDAFVATIGEMMRESIRPDISLGKDGVSHIVSSGGTWKPTGRIPLPKTDDNTAILKQGRSLNESLVEQARKGNKGCYLLSWIFILAVVAALVAVGWLLLSSFGVI